MGCGQGRHSRIFTQKGCIVVGCEPSPDAARYLEDLMSNQNFTFVGETAENFNADGQFDNQFDGVWCELSLPYTKDLNLSLKNLQKA